ncbi:MAG: NAD(P)-binding domain-containing protein, partial [Bacteroidetes bacterium]|nr:NAD(P)-binding domain-containing protein [Bacteroidota bacterium]
MSKIAIIGTGNVGGALATKWSKKGHTIYLGVNDQQNFKGKELLSNGNTTVCSIKEAVSVSDVILVAIPSVAIIGLIEQMGDVTNKVIIDATNSVMKGPEPYKTAYHCIV